MDCMVDVLQVAQVQKGESFSTPKSLPSLSVKSRFLKSCCRNISFGCCGLHYWRPFRVFVKACKIVFHKVEELGGACIAFIIQWEEVSQRFWQVIFIMEMWRRMKLFHSSYPGLRPLTRILIRRAEAWRLGLMTLTPLSVSG